LLITSKEDFLSLIFLKYTQLQILQITLKKEDFLIINFSQVHTMSMPF
jgi:hypothetical protein